MRRLAVFGGYNHPEPAPAWPRVIKSAAPRLREAEDPDTVIRLEALVRPMELYRAA